MSLTYFEEGIQTIRDQAARAQHAYEQTCEVINSNPNLSSEGKAAEIEKHYTTTRQRLDQLRNQEKDRIDTKIRELESSLDAKTGNASTDIIAFRDAQDRADRIDDPAEAERVLERAIRTNDKSLSHAVFRRALAESWSGVTKRFIAEHPEVADVVKDLNRLQSIRDNGFARTVKYAIFR